MDAIVFDFDGVLVDSEPVHLRAFQQVLAPIGVPLARDDYYQRYLGFDDRQCLATILADSGAAVDRPRMEELIAAKTRIVQRELSHSPPAVAGAIALMRTAAGAGVPVAICSSALREEIDTASRAIGIAGLAGVVVAAEDVPAGKPDPACYVLAIELLAQRAGRPLQAGRCVAVEDSPFGIAAARGAGMKVLAVTSSYHRSELAQADLVVDSFDGLDLSAVEKLAGPVTRH